METIAGHGRMQEGAVGVLLWKEFERARRERGKKWMIWRNTVTKDL